MGRSRPHCCVEGGDGLWARMADADTHALSAASEAMEANNAAPMTAPAPSRALPNHSSSDLIGQASTSFRRPKQPKTPSALARRSSQAGDAVRPSRRALGKGQSREGAQDGFAGEVAPEPDPTPSNRPERPGFMPCGSACGVPSGSAWAARAVPHAPSSQRTPPRDRAAQRL
jgi:hypothetical protein